MWRTTFAHNLAVGLIAWAATFAAAAPVEQLPRDEIRELERAGKWQQACQAYVQLLAQDRQQPDLQERLRYCVRRLNQSRRQTDPAYRTTILSLPVSQTLALYVDVLNKLHGQYADRDKVPIDRLFQHGLDEFRTALSDPAFLREHLAGVDEDAVDQLRAAILDAAGQTISTTKEARAVVRDMAWEAQRLTGLNPTLAIMEFACGACNALDEFTFFLTPGQALDDPTALSGELAAYGLLVNWKDRQLVVERIVPGSWAAGLGVQAGDSISHIGQQATNQMLPSAVADLLRTAISGETGSTVTELTIVSPSTGGSPPSRSRTVTLPGFVPSVLDDRMERDGVGYVRLASFQTHTVPELDSALLRLRSEGMRVLILDLRGNPGGRFISAVQAAERFLPSGIIVTTQGQVRAFARTYLAQSPMTAFDMPMVVLVDGETASAAEIVAGALKDNQRAVLVGQTTFGKGSVQRLLTLQAGAGVYLTLARFYSPRGQPFAGVGVTPDIMEPRRDAMKDTQLELAVEQALRLLMMR